MQSSISIARATATLPRNWSKKVNCGHPMPSDARYIKRLEGANKTRLILQKYLERGIEPSPEVLDSLDPTNISYDGSLSAASSSAESLTALIIEPTPAPVGKFKTQADAQRCRLVRKQTKRQSLVPSFFEPSVPLLRAKSASGPPVKLTVDALLAHDHPATVFLAPKPITEKFVRRAASFQTLPTIRIIKPVPECLDDHSNPSSRDPFYYDKVLQKIDASTSIQSKKRSSQTRSRKDTLDKGIDSGSVTAWFADQYLSPA